MNRNSSLALLGSFSLIFSFVCAFTSSAHVVPRNVDPDEQWIRFESPTKDFSFALPARGYLVDNEDDAYRVYYPASQVSISVTIEKKGDAKTNFRRVMGMIRDQEHYKFYESGDFLIRQYKPEMRGDNLYTWLDMASSNGSITVSANAQKEAEGIFSRFLASLLVEGKPLFVPAKPAAPESETLSLSSLKTDDLILAALKQPDADEKFEPAPQDTAAAHVDPSGATAPDRKKYSRPLLILRKPRASYTASGRQRGVNGTVKLKVTFGADGRIGPIWLISSVDKGLAKNALAAAVRIKFLAAEIDGKPVDSTKMIEYGFSTY